MSLPKRKQAALLVCLCLLPASAGLAYYRGYYLQLGGTPAKLAGEHATEEDWLVSEIVRDVVEMSTFARAGPPKDVRAIARSVRNGVYRVSAPGVLNGDHEVDLSTRLWDPQPFSALVRAIIGEPPPVQSALESQNVHRRLTELTPTRLTRASDDISRSLATRMGEAALHESAALTIAAFAMRESSGRFNDVRWSLNRTTAHLAMARGLSRDRAVTPDGRIAEAILLTLANHQKGAMAAVEQLEASADADGVRPWTRALRLRLTQEWALLSEPASATLLEKFEYLRARRAVARHSRSVGDFDDLAVNPAREVEWVRILEANPRGVEEGSFLSDGTALGLEQGEALEVRRAIPAAAGREAAGGQGPHLGARATRCITDGRPQILSWGAWAESSQRHLAMLIGAEDGYLRHLLGSTPRAVVAAGKLDQALQDLAMYAPATTFRTKGVRNGDGDATHIRDAITLAINSPERLTVFVWDWLERGSKYEALRVGMPPRVGWFVRSSPRMPYDAANRARLGGYSLSAAELLALREEAPYDYGVSVASLAGRFGEKAPYAEIQKAFGARLSYDLRAMDYALARVPDGEGLELREWACESNATHCAALAATLVRLNRPAEAAAQYERAFADPTFDRVRLANESRWLVNHYRRNGQTDRALALAETSAAIGSYAGKITAAHLYEDLGRFDDAEAEYVAAYKGYDEPAQLLGFYYRAVMIRKAVDYDVEWRSLVATVFPDGLQDAPVSLEGPPKSGVIITNDNLRTIKAGIQAGDIVLGLEGFRADNYLQYSTINAFFVKEEMNLTLWRGRVFTATITAPNRLMGIEMRSYPIQGWREK